MMVWKWRLLLNIGHFWYLCQISGVFLGCKAQGACTSHRPWAFKLIPRRALGFHPDACFPCDATFGCKVFLHVCVAHELRTSPDVTRHRRSVVVSMVKKWFRSSEFRTTVTHHEFVARTGVQYFCGARFLVFVSYWFSCSPSFCMGYFNGFVWGCWWFPCYFPR